MNSDLKEKIKSNFDAASRSYDMHCEVQNAIGKQALVVLEPHKRQFGIIADFACGTGESTKHLLKKVQYEICLAIDFSGKLLKQAKMKLPSHTQYIHADFDYPILKTACLDLIFCNMGLQWSFSFNRTLRLINSYLQDEGLILLTLPADNNFPEIKPEYKSFLPSNTKIKMALQSVGFAMLDHMHCYYKTIFTSTLDALRSIKHIGANTIIDRQNVIKMGLSKSGIDHIFYEPDHPSLTYEVDIYLARKVKK